MERGLDRQVSNRAAKDKTKIRWPCHDSCVLRVGSVSNVKSLACVVCDRKIS